MELQQEREKSQELLERCRREEQNVINLKKELQTVQEQVSTY